LFYFTDRFNGHAISSVQFSATNLTSTSNIDNRVVVVNITISNILLPVSRMTVTLSGLSATLLQDVAVLVSSPTGINVLVMANQLLAACNDINFYGCSVTNVNYTFDQTANATVAANNGISGTWLFILLNPYFFLSLSFEQFNFKNFSFFKRNVSTLYCGRYKFRSMQWSLFKFISWSQLFDYSRFIQLHFW
jgi:hypothetical protein